MISNSFRTLLYLIDLFGRPVTISFSGKERFKSPFGGACSLIFFGFLSWAIYNGSKDLFARTNPGIIHSETYRDDPRELILSPETFPIGIGIQSPTSMGVLPYIDESIYTVDFVYMTMTRTVHGDGTTTEHFTETPLVKEICEAKHFGELGPAFATVSLDTAYCLAQNQPDVPELRIKGAYMSERFEFVTVILSRCDNDTSPITCATEAVQDQFLDGGWFNMLHVGMAIDPNNFTRPDSKFKNVYYTMVSPDTYTEAYFLLSHVDVSTDSGWLISEAEIKNYTLMHDVKESFQMKSHPGGILFYGAFEVDRLEIHYSRTYKKVQDVLAEVGGLANVGLVVILLFTTPFLELKLRESLINELFDIYAPPKSKGKGGNNGGNRKGKDQRQDSTKINIQSDSLETEKNKGSHAIKDVRLDLSKANQTHDSLFNKSVFSPTFYNETKNFDTPVANSNIKPKKQHHQTLSAFSPLATTPKPEERTHLQVKFKNPSFTKFVQSKNSSFQELDVESPKQQPSPKRRLSQKVQSLKLLDKKYEKEQESLNVPKILSETSQQKLEKLVRIDQKVVDDNENPNYPSLISEGMLSDCCLDDIKHPAKDVVSDQEENGEKEEDIPNKVEFKTIQTHNNVGSKYLETKTELQGEPDHRKLRKINLTVWEYFSSFFYQSEALRQKMEVLSEGKANIDARLDVVNILKKLREIDKLKAMLLEYDQLILFNNLPKPEIKSKAIRRSTPVSSFTHDMLRKSVFVEQKNSPSMIFDSQSKIQEKSKKTKIDQKLISIYKDKYHE